jgi:hypothetical protein
VPEPQPGTGADWPTQATDMIVGFVGKVRDHTTGPAITAARGVVYGLLAALLGVTAVVLVAIAAVRGLDEGIEGIVGSRETWAAHGVVGLLFTVVGLLLWSKRRPRAKA